jgi:hypothetical protein
LAVVGLAVFTRLGLGMCLVTKAQTQVLALLLRLVEALAQLTTGRRPIVAVGLAVAAALVAVMSTWAVLARQVRVTLAEAGSTLTLSIRAVAVAVLAQLVATHQELLQVLVVVAWLRP